jgi:hypothetical protein
MGNSCSRAKETVGMEMWCYRRMLKNKRNERITNKEVPRRAGEKRNMNTLRGRRGRFIGNILRQQPTVLEGEISG